jgi:hemoglobin
MRIKMMLAATVATAGLVMACGGGKKGNTTGGGGGSAATKSLYDKLGKMDGITPVVDKFVETVIKDERINSFFKNADKASLKKQLADQICQASGGPCKYTGKDMKTAHTGMGVKEADFTALVEDLSKTLDEFKVPKETKDELLGALAKMKGDIVTP